MIALCFCVGYSYSQEKPSEEVMKNLVININGPKGLVTANTGQVIERYKNIIFNKFNITNNFISNKSGKYCIIVDYNISYEEYNLKIAVNQK